MKNIHALVQMNVGVFLLLWTTPACQSNSPGAAGAGGNAGGAGGTAGADVAAGGAGAEGTAGAGGDTRATDGAADQVALGDDASTNSPPDAASDNSGAPPLPPMVWTQRTSTTSRPLKALASSGAKVVVVGESVILTSSDAIDWSPQTFPTSPGVPSQFESAAFGAGIFVIGGRQSQLLTSPDGVTWSVASTPIGSGWSGVTYASGRFFVTPIDLTQADYLDSPDGVTWTPRHVAADLQSDWLASAVFSANGVLFASSSRYPARSFESLDGGTTWQRIPAWSVLAYDAAFGNGAYCVGGANSTAEGSGDARSWTAVKVYGGSLLGMAFATDRFIVVGTYSLQISPDCLTWSEGSSPAVAEQLPSDTGLNSVRVHKDKVIVVGDNGVILTAPLP